MSVSPESADNKDQGGGGEIPWDRGGKTGMSQNQVKAVVKNWFKEAPYRAG